MMCTPIAVMVENQPIIIILQRSPLTRPARRAVSFQDSAMLALHDAIIMRLHRI
jgi:hypothetical protein